MGINVYQVSTNREFDIFVRLPQFIYYRDPFWLPASVQKTANILLKIPTREVALLVAVDDNIVTSRVAIMANPKHHERNTALFGYFESTNNPEAVKELFVAGCRWAKARGYGYLAGPVSYNTNDSVGLLIEGFNYAPQQNMPYNLGYYSHLLEYAGFSKYIDLLAYLWTHKHPFPHKLARVAEKVRKKQRVQIRKINFNNIHREAQILSYVHNQTMQGNWGSKQLSVGDAANYLNSYRSFAEPDLLLVAEVNREPAGICLTLPNIDSKGFINGCRVAVLGVVPKFRSRGVAALLMHETMARLLRKGYPHAELSLILENNTMMNRILKDTLKCDLIKRFRVYRKTTNCRP
ncbi:GNAT family N-acetyltransferase [Desulfofalx alkaliphila]|uniref:GNAT family N-acetyltransferase n=1 Tax=Desulfofalx alkaliphila TaxID=105483 RepID=UPI0012FF1ECB|nr:GNAT family N-acetyltransferase [Desulfofalx alkaliphila]